MKSAIRSAMRCLSSELVVQLFEFDPNLFARLVKEIIGQETPTEGKAPHWPKLQVGKFSAPCLSMTIRSLRLRSAALGCRARDSSANSIWIHSVTSADPSSRVV